MKFIFILLFLMGCSGSSSSDGGSISSRTSLNNLYQIPGIAGALYKNDAFAEIRTEGVKKAGDPTLLENTDTFHLGSCTKAMTATLAAIFIESGYLDWTTKLSELFPEIEMHEAFLDMTFETLLVHRSGLPSEHDVFHEVRSMDVMKGRKLIAEKILKVNPLSLPGKRYLYSNYNYIIAGYALERLTGDSWEELMKKYIFNPLSMQSCGFGVTSIEKEIIPSRPWGHSRKDGQILPRHFDNPASFGPSSTVHCSLEDWGKFLAVHLDGFNGKSDFLKPETFKKLHSVHPAKDSSYTYGGWNLLQRNWANGPTLSHAGSNTLNYAKVWIAPKRNAFVVSTANIGGDNAFFATDAFIQDLISLYLH